ncbi:MULTISPECIES: LysE family transporter [Vibrio]|uniref:Lysine transporter LysE n=2 Tax=Vibrio TaxID=662 RepID=A0A2N7NLM5_9VIBR|nr:MULTISPECIES: LysE family transporter [Vibrio]EAQ54879.1 transporter, LysE family protein [Vibrio sp. MED222]PMP16668.1 lysine transporter LysE [Vibrio tasmaniensis]TKG37813.1 lysine transporter LysE [Vibrio tasmaniensis]TKG43252.1 lysine transporter LysE [Vibrio tasmaniensis]TKG43975.1 lysine transporter LysE [Vibrio tasmaniensis]
MDAGLVGIFVTVAIAHFLALLSPGPDFVIVVKSAVKNKGRKALGVAFGIASANAVYIGLCLIGVGSILAASVSVMIALKIIGGLFLVYLAVQAIRAKKCNYSNIDVVEEGVSIQTTFLKEFVTGFLSGILNPKNLLFYLSLFTVVLNNEVGFMFKLGLGIWMTVVVFVWDAAIIFLLSAPKVRREFTRVAYYIDKVTGVMLGLLGLTIVKSALVRQ